MTCGIRFILLGALLIASSLADFEHDPGNNNNYEDGHSEMDEWEPDEEEYKIPLDSEQFVPKYVKVLDGPLLEKFKSSQSVTAVVFTQNVDERSSFFKAYDKAAGFLNAYGLSVGLVDCSATLDDVTLKQACDQSEEDQIYTYRKNASVLTLDINTMFDVNSIMSNILQLALLDEVSIVQTEKKRQLLEHSMAGQTDIVYSYHESIGTYDHRVFMEIAYAYQDKFKFVVSTEKSSIADLQDAHLVGDNSCMVWVMYCRDAYNAATGCRSVNYRGEITLLSMATFFKQLSWPRLVHQTDMIEAKHPCEESTEFPCVYISHSAATLDLVKPVADSLQFDLHGIAGLVIVERTGAVEIGPGGTTDPDPMIQIHKSGPTHVVMRDPWGLENIEAFIVSNLIPRREDKFAIPADDGPENTSEADLTKEEEDIVDDRIDDMVVRVEFEHRRAISKSLSIPALTDKTFPQTIEDNKLVVALFYLPYDSIGMLFLGPFQEAGRMLADMKGEDPSDHPLVRVNCFDWTDVCAKENITSYPVVHIYREGQKRQQYRHALDKDVLVRSVWLLQANQPVVLKTSEEVESFVVGSGIPKTLHQVVDNLVLLNPSKSKAKQEVKAFKEVAKRFETQMLFAIVSAGLKTERVAEGGVLHVRLSDKFLSTETLTRDLTVDSIQQFLLKGQFHLLPELTYLNFPALYARQEPFGILFYQPRDDTTDPLVQSVINTIKTNKAPGLLFCKMSILEDGGNPVAEAILYNYTLSVVLPSFAVVNHQKGQVHVLQGDDVKSEEHFLPWIKDVQDGSVQPLKILERGEWKPTHSHYDFLSLIEKDKREKSRERQYPSEDKDDSFGHEVDIRNTLLDLQHSRLYSSKERKQQPPAPTAEELLPAQSAGTNAASTATTDAKGEGRSTQHTEL